MTSGRSTAGRSRKCLSSHSRAPHPLVKLVESALFGRRLGDAANMYLQTGKCIGLDCYMDVRSNRLHLPKPEQIVGLDDLGSTSAGKTSRSNFRNDPQSYARVLDIKFMADAQDQIFPSDEFFLGIEASTLDYDDRPVVGIAMVEDDQNGTIALIQRSFPGPYNPDAIETVLEQARAPPCEISAHSNAREIEQRLGVPGFITSSVLYFERGPHGSAQCTNSHAMHRFSYGLA